jgi:hypothetical protein
MGTWGAGNFENDAALDFIGDEIDRYISIIEDIFGNEGRFLLDEDAEGMLMPAVEILAVLCEHCHGVLPEHLDVAAWKARYLAMYDDQIDGLEPQGDFKQQRRAVIEATFDKLVRIHEEQRHDKDE